MLENNLDKFVEDSTVVSEIAKNYIRKERYDISLGVYIFLLSVIKEKIITKLKCNNPINILSDLFLSVLSQARIAGEGVKGMMHNNTLKSTDTVNILDVLFKSIDVLIHYGNSMHKHGSSPYIKNSLSTQLGITSNNHKMSYSKALSIMTSIGLDNRVYSERKRVLRKEMSDINKLIILLIVFFSKSLITISFGHILLLV